MRECARTKAKVGIPASKASKSSQSSPVRPPLPLHSLPQSFPAPPAYQSPPSHSPQPTLCSPLPKQPFPKHNGQRFPPTTPSSLLPLTFRLFIFSLLLPSFPSKLRPISPLVYQFTSPNTSSRIKSLSRFHSDPENMTSRKRKQDEEEEELVALPSDESEEEEE